MSVHAFPPAAIPSCGIYLISRPAWREGDELRLEEALATGGISSFQLRLKEVSDEEILSCARALIPLCHQYGVMFILNDRADLAKACDADGVHLGGDDGAISSARALLGEKKIIGVSCYDSIDLALQAGEKTADYVSFGTFFPSVTKNSSGKPTPEILEWWSNATVIPCVAIGGINAENCGSLVKAGADFIAVISAVWDHPEGIKAGVMALRDSVLKAALSS